MPCFKPYAFQTTLSRPRGPPNRRRPSRSPRPSIETYPSDPLLSPEVELSVGPVENSKVTEGWCEETGSGVVDMKHLTAKLASKNFC